MNFREVAPGVCIALAGSEEEALRPILPPIGEYRPIDADGRITAGEFAGQHAWPLLIDTIDRATTPAGGRNLFLAYELRLWALERDDPQGYATLRDEFSARLAQIDAMIRQRGGYCTYATWDSARKTYTVRPEPWSLPSAYAAVYNNGYASAHNDALIAYLPRDGAWESMRTQMLTVGGTVGFYCRRRGRLPDGTIAEEPLPPVDHLSANPLDAIQGAIVRGLDGIPLVTTE